jgi:hypothetical protein
MQAPDIKRAVVKLAASMLVCFNARRHSSELPAKASMAKDTRLTSRSEAIAWCGVVWRGMVALVVVLNPGRRLRRLKLKLTSYNSDVKKIGE